MCCIIKYTTFLCFIKVFLPIFEEINGSFFTDCRYFANMAYETHIGKKGRQWKFDFTYNWLGQQRLPNTATNSLADRFPDYAPSFSLINAQVTRTFSSTFEMYVGAENLGNYTQDKAILGNQNPFGANFDTSIVYAPIFGQMFYAGLRFKIK
jgi:hypothetical protein